MPTNVPPELEGMDIDILQTGNWWVVKLIDPGIGAQGESREEALDKLAKRFEQYEERKGARSDWTDSRTLQEDPRLSVNRDGDEFLPSG